MNRVEVQPELPAFPKQQRALLTLLFLFVVGLAGAVTAFLLLRSGLSQGDFAGTPYAVDLPLVVAGLLLTLSVVLVHRILESRRAIQGAAAAGGAVISFEAYGIPWYVMSVYGIVLAFAASRLGTLLMWLSGELTGLFFTSLLPVLNTLFLTLAFYFVGAWLGDRVHHQRVISAVAVLFGYKLAELALALMIDPAAGAPNLLLFGLTTFFFMVAILIGVWRGYRARYVSYLRYLLRRTPAAMQPVVVDSAYQEVTRLLSVPTHDPAHVTTTPIENSAENLV
jgi:hypothetical protein